MQTTWDLIVVGAGPAGLASACVAAEYGLEVLVLDEQLTPGGQIYRNISRQSPYMLHILGKEYHHGLSLVQRFRDCHAEYLAESTVWRLKHDGRVAYSRGGVSREVQAKRIIIATGAMERPVPFSGWTLPGVMGAGAVDAVIKNDAIAPSGPVTMVGSGPIMLLVANHLHKLGVEVAEYFDTSPTGSIMGAMQHLPSAMKRPGYLLTGVSMVAETWKTVGRYNRNVTAYGASGENRVERITVTKSGKDITVPTSSLLVHEGVIPRTEFSRQLHLEHNWDPVQRFWYPRVDGNGRTSSKVIFMAGDGAFVHGATPSAIKGQLSGLAVVRDLGKETRQSKEKARALQKQLTSELLPRPFVDAMYRPRRNLFEVDDEVIVCRCEEVTAGAIRDQVKKGQRTLEMVKAVTRCGMGPCQGRMCGIALTEIIAAETGTDIDQIKPHNIRPPVRNIGLGELANMTLLPTVAELERDK